MKIVALREPGTGCVFDLDANQTAMELPPDWPDDAVVMVSGDERVSTGGRTVWRVVQVVTAVRIGEPPILC